MGAMNIEDSESTYLYVIGILAFIPLIVHGIGLHVLYIAKKASDFHRLHLMLLMALSTLSVVIAVTNLLKRISIFFKADDPYFFFAIELITNAFLYMLYISILSIIVVDRCLLFHFKLRYTSVWTQKKLKITFLIFTVLAFIVSLVFAITFRQETNRMDIVLGFYLWPALDYFFLLINLAALLYFFFHRQNSPADFRSRTSSNLPNIDVDEINHENQKRRAVFFMFVISFFLLVFVPDQLYFILYKMGFHDRFNTHLYNVTSTFWLMHLTGNALLYLTTCKKLRHILIDRYWSKFKCIKMTRKRNSSMVEPIQMT